MGLDDILRTLPDASGRHLVVLSGGLDSSILAMLLAKRYGAENVFALSFRYGQKQVLELEKARRLTLELGISHRIIELGALGDIAREVSANIAGTDLAMPKIQEVLGDPQPVTYVPYRNLIFFSFALAQAEAWGAKAIYVGLQIHDEYGYWDTTEAFVEGLNQVAAQNRKSQIRIYAPFADFSKYQEIELVKEMKLFPLLHHTLTCYQPNSSGESCGTCPSCSERIANFAKAGVKDPISYSEPIDWETLLHQYQGKR